MRPYNRSKPIVLITGASRGIGRQLAIDCARAGMTVVINFYSNAPAAQDVAAQIKSAKGETFVVQADASVQAEVATMIKAIIDRFGRIDVLINNAGVGRVVDLADTDEHHFDETIRVNLRSAFLISQEVIPHMIRAGEGRLIFMSSLAARTGGLVSGAYAASKAGMEGLMHYYATQLLGRGITSNAIAPALIDSDMVKEMVLPPGDQLPLGRLGRADEIWPAVRMILETEYMTGQTIHINAGRYMT